MRTTVLTWLLPGLTAFFGAAILTVWLTHDPATDISLHRPGMGGDPAFTASPETAVIIGEHFASGNGMAPALSGSWPRFRGALADNISREPVPLADRWTDEQPAVLWQVELGEGHAGASIHRGRVYVLDYDETARRDVLRCFSLADGHELWQRGYHVEIARNHGMSRTVPAVTDRYAVTLGPKCHVMCVDAETGDFLWGIDLRAEYGTKLPMWYTGQCPLIVNDTAILAPAGDTVLMIGVDCATGAILWETPNPYALDMSHSSIMPAVIHGVDMYVYSGLGGMVGVAANGAREGDILWYAPQWDRSVMAPSPIVFENGRIFVTAGYGGGSMMLKVMREGDDFSVEPLDTFRANQGLASEQQTPVLYGGYLFGVLPNDAGTLRNQLVCAHPDDPRAFLWTSGRDRRFGLGPYLAADGKLYVLSDDGVLHMIEAGADAYMELGRKRILDAHDAWGPMALADGFLVLRDDSRMLCVDLRP